MGNADFIPAADALFFKWQGNLINYLTARQSTWLPPGYWQRLLELQTDYVNKRAVADNPATQTPTAILLRNEARAAYTKELRQVIKSYLVNNPLVNDGDKMQMGIPIHKTTRTPAEVAKTFPGFRIDCSIIRCVIVHFYSLGEPESKAKPPGQHGAEIYWAMLPAPPASLTELVHSSIDTRTPFTLSFDENDRGKTVYLALRWENTRGEKGPWSAIQSAIIP
ncbi:MAG: hypothetical protein LBK12_08995 [Odoribacteraceae bacterium]|jgi:hypothetical protein|nr:hypothetical protein [Odoribacteraceae bacterium]